MADDVDRADAVIQHVIDDARANAKRALDNPSLRPIILELDGVRFGCCHYCSEPVPVNHLYCSRDCATDHQHLMARNKANGI